ncbi:MAG: VC0807 family protein [Acidimicrobiales bacterium]
MPETWEPGAPSLRAMGPGAIGGAVIPLGVYYLVRSHVGGDAPALMIAGCPAAAWVGVEWVRRRRLDPIGSIVLFGFIAGLLASVLLGNSAFVLKVRDSAFTGLFGLACLVSLTRRRPLMFFFGRALSAGDDQAKLAAYEEMWQMPSVPRTFRLITAAWGVGLLAEAAARVLLALALPTGMFLALSPVLGGVVIGGLFAFTFWFAKRARRLGEARFAGLGLAFPSVPTGEGDLGAAPSALQ